MSIDPHPGDQDDPSSLNEYLYTANNPINRIDPDGDYWETALDIATFAMDLREFQKKKSISNAAWLGSDIVGILLPGVVAGGMIRNTVKTAERAKYTKANIKVIDHFIQQSIKRKVTIQEVKKTLQKGKRYYDPKYGTKIFHYQNIAVSKLKKGKGALSTVIKNISKPKKRWVRWR